MMFRRLSFAAVVLLLPLQGFAASREIQELQRDVALLQEQLRTLQRSQDEKLSALNALLQQTLDSANKANTAVAVLDNAIRSILRDQESKVVAPVAGVGSKIDQMQGDIQALRGSVEDVTARMGRLQQMLTDVNTAVKTMQAPAAPPPGAAPGPGGTASAAPGGVPPIPATTLWTNAMRDRSGGNLDMALQEFTDYVKWYGDTDLAPEAFFRIGEIHMSRGNLEQAVTDFDVILERYQDNPRTPDAMLMKGKALVKLNQRMKGVEEFRALIKRFPSSDQAAQARAQLKALGLSAPATAPAAKAKKRK
jgi:TolA-binding protein